VLKAPGYQALLRAVDPVMLLAAGGGTSTNPNLASGTDPTSPVWDAMGVGAWSQFNSSLPPGEQVKPGVAKEIVDPTLGPLSGAIVVPEGGLRAVLFEVFIRGIPRGRLAFTLEVEGEVLHSTVDTGMVQTGFGSAAFVGEHLRPGAVGFLTLTAEGPADETMVAIDERGDLNLGTVAGGDDGLRLVRAGDVTLFERYEAEFARLHDAVVVRSDPVEAAAFIATSGPARPAVVDRDVGLPEVGGGAELVVEAAEVEPGRVVVRTRTDRSALLVVAQNDYPGWSVEIDGVPSEIVTADGSFSGVVVPEGAHVSIFTFKPRHLTATSVVALLSLLVSIGILVRARRAGLTSGRRSGR
jgi:hypothetical protein